MNHHKQARKQPGIIQSSGIGQYKMEPHRFGNLAQGDLQTAEGKVQNLGRQINYRASLDWCRGVPFGLVDVNRDRIVSLGEAEDAMTSALPKHVERAGFAQGCKLVTRPGARGCFAKYSTRTLVASATGWTTRDGFSASWSRARCRQRAWRARAPRAMSCDARLVHALAARSRSRGCRVSRDHVRLRSIFALGRVILAYKGSTA